MKRLAALSLLITLTCVFAGCAGNANPPQSSNVDGDGNRVSTIPWNRPQQWEGGGALGSALGQ